MALTPAEKQQRYRERHLGIDGTKERIQVFVSVHTKAQLGRLARHHGYTITMVIEDLVAAAESALIEQLPWRQRKAYLDSDLQHNAGRNTPAPEPPPRQRRSGKFRDPRRDARLHRNRHRSSAPHVAGHAGPNASKPGHRGRGQNPVRTPPHGSSVTMIARRRRHAHSHRRPAIEQPLEPTGPCRQRRQFGAARQSTPRIALRPTINDAMIVSPRHQIAIQIVAPYP